MRLNRIVTLLCASALIAAATASAAPTPTAAPSPQVSPDQAQKLSPVVVTATRIEQPLSEIGTTVTVVEKSQIQSQQIQSVDNVLRQVPSVTVMQSGSPGTQAEVMIRGATTSQTLIRIESVGAK